MKNRIAVCLVVISLMFTGIGYAKTYKISVVSWPGWAPCHVADVKGFWKDEGVDVNVITTSNSIDNMTLFKDGLVDLTLDMLGSAVGMYMDGTPVVILAETDWSHGGDKIIVKKDIDPATLKKQPIGVFFNKPSVTYFLGKYLSSIGLKLSDTRIIEMESDTLTDTFINGGFGIIVNYNPAAMRAERLGNGKIVATSATYEGVMPEGFIVMSDVLKTIPHNDIVKIMKGWIKAAEWIKAPGNWKEYMKILNDHTFPDDPAFSEKDLRELVDAVRIHDKDMSFERNMKDGGVFEYLKNLKVFLKNNQMQTRDFEIDTIFNNKAIIDALGDQ